MVAVVPAVIPAAVPTLPPIAILYAVARYPPAAMFPNKDYTVANNPPATGPTAVKPTPVNTKGNVTSPIPAPIPTPIAIFVHFYFLSIY